MISPKGNHGCVQCELLMESQSGNGFAVEILETSIALFLPRGLQVVERLRHPAFQLQNHLHRTRYARHPVALLMCVDDFRLEPGEALAHHAGIRKRPVRWGIVMRDCCKNAQDHNYEPREREPAM